MSPYRLAAAAAAWSLQAARHHLTALARAEAARRNANALPAAVGLRSPVWGPRCSTGGHADPVGDTLLATPPRETEWATLLRRSDQRLTGIAHMLRLEHAPDPLAAITAAIPRTLPDTARALWMHLRDEDAWVREAIQLDRDERPLDHIPCPNPRCKERRLLVQQAGPVDAWTVVCPCCICVGQGCGCRMPGAVEGAPHIWPRTAVVGAVAGATPTTNTNREDTRHA